MDDPMTRERDLERRIEELERRLAEGSEGSGRWSAADGARAAGEGARSAAEGAGTAFWALMHRVFPEDARRHMKAATREQLITARLYLDRWIDGLGEEAASEPPEEQREKIEIQ